MHVAVVGGGVAGLSAAFTLASAGERVTVLESSHRLGGQILSRKQHGFLVEEGAEGFPVRRDTIVELSRALGLEHRLMSQRVLRSLRLAGGRLEELAPGQAAALLGLVANAGEAGEGLATFCGGMGELINGLADHVATNGRVRTRWHATRLTRHRTGWQVERHGGLPLLTDAVILALPAGETEALLEPVIGGVADLRQLHHSASVTVSLALPRDRFEHPLDASGFVGEAGSMLRACGFCSSKFEDRAPPGWALIRLFFRPEPDALQTPDDVWVGYARQQIADVLGVRGGAWPAWVRRWSRVFPQFPADYTDRLEQLRHRIEGAGVRLELAGAAAGAVGVGGAIRSGQDAAVRTLAVMAA